MHSLLGNLTQHSIIATQLTYTTSRAPSLHKPDHCMWEGGQSQGPALSGFLLLAVQKIEGGAQKEGV